MHISMRWLVAVGFSTIPKLKIIPMSLQTYLRLLHGRKSTPVGSGWKIAGMAFAGLLLGKWYGALSAEE